MDKHASFAKDLTHILLKNKVISDKEAYSLQKLFKESSKENFDDFILEEGLVSKEDLLQALSQLYKVPALDVDGYFFQTFLLHKFPKDVLHRHAFIPMDVDDEVPQDIDLRVERLGDRGFRQEQAEKESEEEFPISDEDVLD